MRVCACVHVCLACGCHRPTQATSTSSKKDTETATASSWNTFCQRAGWLGELLSLSGKNEVRPRAQVSPSQVRELRHGSASSSVLHDVTVHHFPTLTHTRPLFLCPSCVQSNRCEQCDPSLYVDYSGMKKAIKEVLSFPAHTCMLQVSFAPIDAPATPLATRQSPCTQNARGLLKRHSRQKAPMSANYFDIFSIHIHSMPHIHRS